MTKSTPRTRSPELVPLADRVLYMRVFRIATVVLLLATLAVEPELIEGAPTDATLLVTGGYLVVALAGDVLWRLSRRRALWLFGGLLILDGFFLAWITHFAAAEGSALRYLVLLHIVTVSLLASFRTGLKMAMWHSMLLLAAFHAKEAGILTTSDVPVKLGGAEYRMILGSRVAYWVTAIVTCSFAAVNEREQRRRRYDLEALGEFDRKLETEPTADGVGSALVDAVVEEFGFERVLLFTAPTGELVLSHAQGANPAGTIAPAPPDGFLTRAGAERSPLLVSGVPADAGPLAELMPEARNLALVPLHAAGPVGLLVCEHGIRRGSRIERRVVSMLQRYASQGALALTGAWRLERLERSASTDGLTGVANRHVFDEALTRELARAARLGGSVTLAMLDIDHFKRVNDTHGHLAGDDVLCAVAECVGGHIRITDTLARFGGEEFALVLPDTGGDEALVALDRIRRDVRGLRPNIDVTISVGLASYPNDAADPLTLIERADAALYASKRGGRDRCTAAATLAA
jgi:diguanylate cyclase (GGDEF)-like protein